MFVCQYFRWISLFPLIQGITAGWWWLLLEHWSNNKPWLEIILSSSMYTLRKHDLFLYENFIIRLRWTDVRGKITDYLLQGKAEKLESFVNRGLNSGLHDTSLTLSTQRTVHNEQIRINNTAYMITQFRALDWAGEWTPLTHIWTFLIPLLLSPHDFGVFRWSLKCGLVACKVAFN